MIAQQETLPQQTLPGCSQQRQAGRDRRDRERPRWEMADVIRRFEQPLRERYGPWLTTPQDRALRELRLCRTAALGGHINTCNVCQAETQAFNSCRNRNCPKCQGRVRAKWYEDRAAEMLPVEYQHLVFTLPDEIAQLARDNATLIYNLLFRAASQAVLRYGERRLHLQLGFAAVLHGWGQLLNPHPHVHLLMPGGGLSLDGQHWVTLAKGEALPHEALQAIFQNTFLRLLQYRHRKGELILRGEWAELKSPEAFQRWLEPLREKRWVVYAEVANRRGESFSDEDARKTIKYLARYASGVALSNDRLLNVDDSHVTFSYKDYRDGGQRKEMTLPGVEFLWRFLGHVLPNRFYHIRNYGFLSPNQRTDKLKLIRQLLELPAAKEPDDAADPPDDPQMIDVDEDERDSAAPTCRQCGQGQMIRGPVTRRPTVAEIMRMPLPWHATTRSGPAAVSAPVPRPPPPPEQLRLPLKLIPWFFD